MPPSDPSSLPPLPGHPPPTPRSKAEPDTHATSASGGASAAFRSTSGPAAGAHSDEPSFNAAFFSIEPVPKRIGPYRVIRELGQGGMGVVLMAMRDDDKFHKRVALKLIKRGMDTESVLRRFKLEKQVLGALNHPNIARVFDAGATDDGRPYVAMEYIEGMKLDEFCDTHELTVPERLFIFQKICSAVHHAHQNLVVHRDIKPGNILVTTDGEPKLLDFGIAKLLNPDMAGMTLGTEGDRGPMTPEYASPEQVQGQPVSTASDVYALGVLLFELLTGRRPYGLRTRARDAVIRAIIEQEPGRPSAAVTADEVLEAEDGSTRTRTAGQLAKSRGGLPSKLRRTLCGDLDNIVLMAMRKSPRRRYSSAEQMAEDIQRHIDGRPVIAAPETWVYLAGKFVKRNRWGVAAAAAVGLSLAVGAGIATLNLARARAAEKSAVQAAAEADAQREVAQSRESELRKFANSILAEDSKMRQMDAPTSRWMMVRGVATALEAIAHASPDDVEVARMRANAIYSTGAALGGAGAPNLDKPNEALEAFELALHIREGMLARSTGDPALRREVATTLYEISRIQGVTSKKIDRSAAVEKAIEVLGKPEVTADKPGARLFSMLLLQRSELTAAALPDAAERDVAESIEIRRALYDADPSSVTARRDLTVALGRRAEILDLRNDFEQALDLAAQCVNLRRQSMKEESNPRTQRDVMNALGKQAEILDHAGKTKGRDAILAERLDLAEKLVESTGDRRSVDDLVTALQDSALSAFDEGRFPASVALFTQAVTRAVTFGEPTDNEKLERLAKLEWRLGSALSNSDQPDKAPAALRSAKSHFKALLTRLPQDRDLAADLEQVEQALDAASKP